MAPESPLPALTPRTEAAKPDRQLYREGKGRQQRRDQKREAADEGMHPLRNEQGQMTGKLIDTTA